MKEESLAIILRHGARLRAGMNKQGDAASGRASRESCHPHNDDTATTILRPSVSRVLFFLIFVVPVTNKVSADTNEMPCTTQKSREKSRRTETRLTWLSAGVGGNVQTYKRITLNVTRHVACCRCSTYLLYRLSRRIRRPRVAKGRSGKICCLFRVMLHLTFSHVAQSHTRVTTPRIRRACRRAPLSCARRHVPVRPRSRS